MEASVCNANQFARQRWLNTQFAVLCLLWVGLAYGCGDGADGQSAQPDLGSQRGAIMDAFAIGSPSLDDIDQGPSARARDTGLNPGDAPPSSSACELDDRRCGPSGERQRCAYNPESQQAEWSSEGFCPIGDMCLDGVCQTGDDAPCSDRCSAGQSRCSGEQIQFCATGADGCMAWMQPLACDDNGRCIDGVCSQDDGCRNTCFQGQTQCVGNAVRTCEPTNDGCWAWSTATACEANAICQQGRCLSNDRCQTECILNQSRCAGELIQECLEVEPGCFQFGEARMCPQGDVCRFQECACRDECVLGRSECSDNGIRSCRFQDGCAQWSESTPCRPGTLCQNGQCVNQPCNHECVAAGQRACEGDQIKVCQLDANRCRTWGPAENCEPGRVCSEGGCVPDCQDRCQLVGTTRCDGDRQVVQCLRDARTQCTDWVDFFECALGQLCDDGRCVRAQP